MAFAAGALADGYVGEVGRTWPVGDVNGADALYRRSNDLWERLVDACRPGAPASDLLAAYDAAGEPLPPMPVAHGLGLGFDPPVISPDLPQTSAAERLDPGTVLAVTAYVWEAGVGAVFSRDAVLITDDGPEVLTSSPSSAVGATVGSTESERNVEEDSGPRPKRSSATRRTRRPRSRRSRSTGRSSSTRRPRMRGCATRTWCARPSVDNDVKVVVIRGVGDNLGSGADLPEFMEGNDDPAMRLRELKVEDDGRR